MRRTLVYQAWDGPKPPAWITTCMDHARAWAERRGFDYRRHDDDFYAQAPDWAVARAKGDRLMLSDPCRLVLAERHLAQGYDRVIWIDADVLIFRPDEFDVDCSATGYLVCSEVWLTGFSQNGAKAVMKPVYRRNGCVLAFDRGNAFLPFYLDACWHILRHVENFTSWSLGPGFLTPLFERLPGAVKHDVGMMHPAILLALRGRLSAGADALAQYVKLLPVTPRAANMGGSVAGKSYGRFHISHDDMGVIVDRLLAHGDLLAAALPFDATI
jgi:hypothetical protein